MNRKSFLKNSLIIGTGVAAVGTEACSLFDEKEMKVCMETELKENEYLMKTFNRKDIFLTYIDGQLTIFSLICRHKRCTVKYNTTKSQFICPCHDGIYDRSGKVVSGPPPGPLRKFKHEIRNGEIWVINEWVGS